MFNGKINIFLNLLWKTYTLWVMIEATPSVKESTVVMTWREAFHYCDKHDMRMISKEDFRRIPPQQDKSIWLGKYQARTDFLTYLGCFQFKNNVYEKLTTFSTPQMGKEQCFFKCIDANANTGYVGLSILKIVTCLCFPKDGMRTYSEGIASCNGSCYESWTCTNNNTFSVYKIENPTDFKTNKGWCGYYRHPFRKLKQASCKKAWKQYFCINSFFKNVSNTWNESKALPWYRAVDYCESEYEGETRMAELNDFKNLVKDRNDTEAEYWVPTRVYLRNIESEDLLVYPKFMYTCSVLHPKYNLKNVSCTRKYYVHCINDMDTSHTKRTTYAIQVYDYNSTNGSHIYLSIIVGCTFLGVIFLLLAVGKYIARKRKRSAFVHQRELWYMKSRSEDTHSTDVNDSDYDFIPDDLVEDIDQKCFEETQISIEEHSQCRSEIEIGRDEQCQMRAQEILDPDGLPVNPNSAQLSDSFIEVSTLKGKSPETLNDEDENEEKGVINLLFDNEEDNDATLSTKLREFFDEKENVDLSILEQSSMSKVDDETNMFDVSLKQ